ERIPTDEGTLCIQCQGDGFLVCFRCKGTKKMSEIEDPSKFRDCSECEATGYKPCGFCQTTGLAPSTLKTYIRDEKFRKIVARMRKIKCDEDGRAKIQKVMPAAIAEVEAKRAAVDGREAQVLRAAPEDMEPAGTWLGGGGQRGHRGPEHSRNRWEVSLARCVAFGCCQNAGSSTMVSWDEGIVTFEFRRDASKQA
ncbi:unnamed protein product, partial [Effrenium voratum]